MTTEHDNSNSRHELCRLLELDEATTLVAELLHRELGPDTVGFALWDEDLEEYDDTVSWGAKKADMEALLSALVEELESEKEGIAPLDEDLLNAAIEKAVTVQLPGCAALVLAGDFDADPEKIQKVLDLHPVRETLKNSWLYTELIRENRRLRSSYDELEDKTTDLEEQTRRMINDMTMRDSLRTKQVERERLVYWISHLVKSSVRIQEVLETAVEKIGTSLSLSRCHILRAGDNDSVDLYDYNDGQNPNINDLLLHGDGREFTRAALSLKSAQYFENYSVEGVQDQENNPLFDPGFMQKLGTKSGLVQPLIMREKVLGVLFLEDFSEMREWSIDDMALIGSLADNLAVAIENADLHREVEKQAVTDGLTGVSNRRSFNEALEREFERAKRYSQDLSLIVVDLDFLKKINDTYGHMAGDEAIKNIGRVLAQSSRSTDITARYGGEEFCVLLPNTDIDMAEQLGERLRRLIAETHVDGPGNLSASLGVAAYPLHADSADSLFLKADEALYRAKQDGRNCIRVASLEKKDVDGGQSSGDSKQSLVQEKS
ncbi:MAG: sensor domain-containing diguanylate cyclase [Cyanobacteriota/Melainabacteria group bacterium]